MTKQFRIRIDTRRCKQCGICSYFCPKQVLAQSLGEYPEAAHQEDCIGCRLCELRCPDFAIEVEAENEE